jgi:ubiquinone/menaquinone biosynthesis C-methylase UbiE
MSKKQKETVQKQFTRTAEAFAKFAVRDSADVVREKIDFIKPQATDVTLDVACGPGTLVLGMAPRVKFARGTDLTFEMLRRARAYREEQHLTNVCFDQADAEELPYPDGTFDLVTCQHALHHMSKPEASLREMARVTKPGGRLVIIDTLAPESDSKYELHNRVDILRDPSHVLSMRLTTLLRYFEEMNLEVARQAVRRRERSFNQWMLRAGLKPSDKNYKEARRLLEESMDGDRAGYGARPEGEDIIILHPEGMFYLIRNVNGA